MIADDSGSQEVLRSSAIIWKHTSAIACDRDRRRSQTIAEDRAMFYLLRPSAIICDRLRSCDHITVSACEKFPKTIGMQKSPKTSQIGKQQISAYRPGLKNSRAKAL